MLNDPVIADRAYDELGTVEHVVAMLSIESSTDEDDVADLYDISKDELLDLEGWGEQSAANLLAELEDSKDPSLAAFLSAIGIPKVGSTVARGLAQHFGELDALMDTDTEEFVQDELDAAAKLDIPYYVFHPGAHTGVGEKTGTKNVGERLSDVDIPNNVTLLLENTAGKGTTVGKRLEDLNDMVKISAYEYGDLGICLDTCHLFAAGYGFTDDAAMDDLVEEIDSTVGIENVQYLHLNDSKHPLGSEKDEHEHIGEGEISEEGFGHFINHEALREKPMVLETPEDGKGYKWNIEKIRELRTGD